MANSVREGKKKKRNSPTTTDKEIKMYWIRAATAVCLIVLFVHIEQVEGKCELSPYKPVKTASEIKTNLQKIVSYCERKIGMAEIKKKWLESDLKKLEDLNQKSAEEKRTKDNKVKILNAQISKLQSEIASLQRQILHKNKLIRDITQRIITAGWNIAAANNRVNSLTASIRSKQAHIDALNRRIAKERAKRRCFGRKRRSVEERAPRVRRGWRVRRVVRRVGRVVRKVARETRRVVKQVVTLPKCVVDNIVSRLTRSKEMAEREKNSLNWQLSQAQRAKINAVGDRNRLTAQKNADSRTLNTLNTSFKSMNTKFISSNYQKRTSDRDVCELNSRITELKRVIKTTDNRLKFIREAKSKLLGILSQLKTIRSSKLEDLEEMEDAGEDVADLLEDIKNNEAIRKSVQTLIKITCGTSFTADIQTGRRTMARVLKLAAGRCGRGRYHPYPIFVPRPFNFK